MLWVLSVAFALLSNSYFGWNWAPKSDAELICDGLTMLLVAVALADKRRAEG